MNILKRFEWYVEENKLFSHHDKILVAVSGGKDSMLLLWLFTECKFNIEIAHCNFHLRGIESDGDEQLVQEYALQHNIPIHVKHFDTKLVSKSNKVSIQMAARELRYNWFEELRRERNCQVIAVAQHKNDSIETVLFNLSRGTGLSGLQGILPKREDSKVVRPILFLQSKEIKTLVEKFEIPYRDDSSNFSNKYARNKIRLDIIPQFEKLNAEFIGIMDDNIQRFRDSQELLSKYIDRIRTDILIPRGLESWLIQKDNLINLSLNECYFVFEPFGFNKNVLKDLLNSLTGESGRRFESNEYTIITDREKVILSKKSQHTEEIIFDTTKKNVQWCDFDFLIETTEDTSIEKTSNIVKVDLDVLIFPLKLRSWEEGDVFQPLGMKGKKKLSDYFIQKKINVLDKKRVPILVNGDGRIIWIANYHLDERFKIRDNTQKVLKLVCNLQAI